MQSKTIKSTNNEKDIINDNMEHIDGYKYVKTKNEIRAIEMKKRIYEDFYENIIFQITLTCQQVMNYMIQKIRYLE